MSRCNKIRGGLTSKEIDDSLLRLRILSESYPDNEHIKELMKSVSHDETKRSRRRAKDAVKRGKATPSDVPTLPPREIREYYTKKVNRVKPTRQKSESEPIKKPKKVTKNIRKIEISENPSSQLAKIEDVKNIKDIKDIKEIVKEDAKNKIMENIELAKDTKEHIENLNTLNTAIEEVKEEAKDDIVFGEHMQTIQSVLRGYMERSNYKMAVANTNIIDELSKIINLDPSQSEKVADIVDIIEEQQPLPTLPQESVTIAAPVLTPIVEVAPESVSPAHAIDVNEKIKYAESELDAIRDKYATVINSIQGTNRGDNYELRVHRLKKYLDDYVTTITTFAPSDEQYKRMRRDSDTQINSYLESIELWLKDAMETLEQKPKPVETRKISKPRKSPKPRQTKKPRKKNN